jgi:peptidoglycan/xylan/chitin deacetylase (PgdA/CDA1 family)
MIDGGQAGPGSVDSAEVARVALTFDDGPGAHTKRLLGTLAQYQARSTFFVIGQNVANNPQIVRDQVAAGHEIGNHTWSHPDLTQLASDEVSDQINLADEAIEAAVGFRPTYVRPPYGALNPSARATIDRPLILWSVDPRDWECLDSDHVASYVIENVRPGDVVLMHDVHRTTVDAVPRILDTLAGRGYHFVTVSELFWPQKLSTDDIWSHRRNANGH